jgi:hypothetical protein
MFCVRQPLCQAKLFCANLRDLRETLSMPNEIILRKSA